MLSAAARGVPNGCRGNTRMKRTEAKLGTLLPSLTCSGQMSFPALARFRKKRSTVGTNGSAVGAPSLSRFQTSALHTEKLDGPLWGVGAARRAPPYTPSHLVFRVSSASAGCSRRFKNLALRSVLPNSNAVLLPIRPALALGIRCDLRAIPADLHAAPAPRAVLAGVIEMKNAALTLSHPRWFELQEHVGNRID